MEVRNRNEIGLKHAEAFRDLRPKPMENPAGIPGTPDTDRLMKDFQKGSNAVTVSQTKDQFRVLGTEIDIVG